MSQQHLSELEFRSLTLKEALQAGIEASGFERCTPIQAQTLPIALAGKDVAGQAQTGTGKTAAFLIAMFQRLLNEPLPPDAERRPRALILAPTRELAIQIAKDAESLGQAADLRIALAYGGTDYDKQRDTIAAGVDVLIGTPGRLIDYFKQKVYSLNAIEVLVLDEADRMFDLGFIKDIRYLLRRLPGPEQRLNLLFSATLSHRVLELAYEHMNDPELIRVEPDKVTADRVRQRIFFPANEEKLPLLVKMLRDDAGGRSMVFVNTKREAEVVEATLQANDIQARAISGDVRQTKRQRMLSEFQEGNLRVLIGTDVASRGLHIPDVTHVYNYDLPQDREDYVHRIGRTARAGASGEAISFGCERYAMSLPDIEDYIGFKIPVDSFAADELPAIERARIAPRRPRDGGGRGRSGAKPRSGNKPRGGARPRGSDAPQSTPPASSAEPADGPAQDSGNGAEARNASAADAAGAAQRPTRHPPANTPPPNPDTPCRSGVPAATADTTTPMPGTRWERRPRRDGRSDKPEPRHPWGPTPALPPRQQVRHALHTRVWRHVARRPAGVRPRNSGNGHEAAGRREHGGRIIHH